MDSAASISLIKSKLGRLNNILAGVYQSINVDIDYEYGLVAFLEKTLNVISCTRDRYKHNRDHSIRSRAESREKSRLDLSHDQAGSVRSRRTGGDKSILDTKSKVARPPVITPRSVKKTDHLNVSIVNQLDGSFDTSKKRDSSAKVSKVTAIEKIQYD